MIIRFESYLPKKGWIWDVFTVVLLAVMVALPWLVDETELMW